MSVSTYFFVGDNYTEFGKMLFRWFCYHNYYDVNRLKNILESKICYDCESKRALKK